MSFLFTTSNPVYTPLNSSYPNCGVPAAYAAPQKVPSGYPSSSIYAGQYETYTNPHEIRSVYSYTTMRTDVPKIEMFDSLNNRLYAPADDFPSSRHGMFYGDYPGYGRIESVQGVNHMPTDAYYKDVSLDYNSTNCSYGQ